MSVEVEGEVRRYVLAYMPLAGVVFGVMVGVRRRSTEDKKRRPERKPRRKSE
jgi:hypothetical protein